MTRKERARVNLKVKKIVVSKEAKVEESKDEVRIIMHSSST